MSFLTRFQLRRGTAAQWTAQNPILADGEEGRERDTGLRKVGDGTTRWASLAYDNPVPTGTYASALIATAVQATNYTAVPKDYVLVDATAATRVITLPAAPADLTRIGVKMVAVSGSFVTTINCGSSDKFNLPSGSATATITLLNQAFILQYVAATATWTVQADDLPLSQLDLRHLGLTGGQVVTASAVGVVPLTLRATVGQTADLLKLQSSAPADVFRVTKTGALIIGTATLFPADPGGPGRLWEFRGGTGGSMSPPYDLSSYFSPSGDFSTGTSITVSNKRASINGQIQGVSGDSSVLEPSMVALSPDVNGPTLAIESRGAMGAGNDNAVALAVYDLDDIIGGATGWSPGYGKKRFALSARGTMFWGANLAKVPLTAYDIKLERASAGVLKMTAPNGAFIDLDSTDSTGAVLRLRNATTVKLYIGTNGTNQSIVQQSGQTCLRFNSGGEVAIGDVDGSGAVCIIRANNAARIKLWLFQTSGQSVDMLQVTTSTGGAVLSRFDKDGYFLTQKIAAPADAAVATSEGGVWWKNTVGAAGLQIKGKDSGGTVVLQDLSKGTAVTAPAGGATIDAESRTAIGQIIAHLQRAGIAA